MAFAAIDDYALIGNCRTGALISRYGSIDWLCFPRFDSPSLFAALLDAERGGHFSVRPTGIGSSSRRYLPGTNVLETVISTATGSLRLMDCMPIASVSSQYRELHPESELLRVVECLSGELDIEIDFTPRPDYGRRSVPMQEINPGTWMLDLGSEAVFLHCSVGLQAHHGALAGRTSLRAGEAVHLSLIHSDTAPAVFPSLGDRSFRAIDDTISWWRDWSRRLQYHGPYREAVIRSALVLKLLAYSPSGAIIAAPTTSLPERIGGTLNWDYRYCWLRDASFTVRAFRQLGCIDEALGFVNWLLHATAITRPELRVLYDVYGVLPGTDRELAHLSGYQGSRPVRIGNTAAYQLQLDVYGEVIDAVAELAAPDRPLDRETQGLLRDYGEYVCRHWQLPDSGIWEDRGAPRHYTTSKALCWVALDRLLRLSEQGLINRIPRDKFNWQREEIHTEIERRGWSEELQCYTGSFDSSQIDVSALLLASYGYVPPASPRFRATLRTIEHHLGAGNGLVFRNDEITEGAFAACSFWIAELLARGAGSLSDGQTSFKQTLSFGNDVGLFAEEIDPATGAALGNFPQAYTHVGLINAALSLQHREDRNRQSLGFNS